MEQTFTLNLCFDGTKQCLVHLGFVEDKPQRVAEIFEGVMAPPCPIDGKPVVFSTRIHANTYLFLLSFVAADDLVSELTYKFDMLRRFINIDETNHSKGSNGDKGGRRSKRLPAITLPAATESILSSQCRPCLSTTRA